MQDEVREKSVALVISIGKQGGRLTADLLKWAIRRYMADSIAPRAHHGKQTVKQLVGQGKGVKNIEITDKNIKSFERVARKYGVDFALKKVTVAETPPEQKTPDKAPERGNQGKAAPAGRASVKYLVFFKAKDADALEAAFAEYTAQTMKRGHEKPSLRKMLEQFMEKAKQQTQVKNRDKGEVAL